MTVTSFWRFLSARDSQQQQNELIYVLPITKDMEGFLKSVQTNLDYVDIPFEACEIRPTWCFKRTPTSLVNQIETISINN